jgi:uncharacterized protein
VGLRKEKGPNIQVKMPKTGGIDIFLYICLTSIGSPPMFCNAELRRGREGGDNMKNLQQAANVLVIVGALNWGLIGLFQLNLVNVALGGMAGLENIVYILVGLSGILALVNWNKK